MCGNKQTYLEQLQQDYNEWIKAISMHEKNGCFHTAAYCRDRLQIVEIKIQNIKNGEMELPSNVPNNENNKNEK